MVDFGNNKALRTENDKLQKQLKDLERKLGGENFELRKLVEVLQTKLKNCNTGAEPEPTTKWEKRWEDKDGKHTNAGENSHHAFAHYPVDGKKLEWFTRSIRVANDARLPFLGDKFGPLVDDVRMPKDHDHMLLMGENPAIPNGDFKSCKTVDFVFMPKEKKESRCMAIIRTQDSWSKEGYMVSAIYGPLMGLNSLWMY
jgi:hypothetical protein